MTATERTKFQEFLSLIKDVMRQTGATVDQALAVVATFQEKR